MWSFLGSVLIAFRWLNYTGTSQIYSHLHRTASQKPSDALRDSGCSAAAEKPLMHLFSCWDPDGITLPFLLLPFPGIGLMSPTWTLSRPHVFLWLPALSDSCVSLWLLAHFYACGETETWHLIHDALNFESDNLSWPKKKKQPHKTQAAADTRWQHKTQKEQAGVTSTRSVPLLGSVRLWLTLCSRCLTCTHIWWILLTH